MLTTITVLACAFLAPQSPSRPAIGPQPKASALRAEADIADRDGTALAGASRAACDTDSKRPLPRNELDKLLPHERNRGTTGPKDWVVSQSDAAQPSAVVVAGQVELTRREAKASAIERLREDTRDRQLEHGRSVIRAAAPFWLPNFVAEQALHEWVRGLGDPLQRSVRILDDDVKVRDHGFGQSFQAFLLIEEDASQADRSGRELERRLDRRVRRFVVLSGGVVGFWAVLAFVVAWIDRLSRGYMTWRLRGIALGLGAAVPAILFLL
jgi:hypothetical protein